MVSRLSGPGLLQENEILDIIASINIITVLFAFNNPGNSPLSFDKSWLFFLKI